MVSMPSLFEEVPVTTLYDEYIADLRTQAGNLNIRDTDPSAIIAQLHSGKIANARMLFNAASFQTSWRFATGQSLKDMADMHGVTYTASDSDDTIRQGISSFYDFARIGTTQATNTFAEEVMGVDEAYTTASHSTGEFTTYILATPANNPTALPGVPAASLLTSVETYINDASRKRALDIYNVLAATVTEYEIAATITHTTGLVEADVRTAVYNYIDERRSLGTNVTVFGLTTAIANSSALITNVNITKLAIPSGTGAADLNPSNEYTAYSCRKTTTNVVLTFTT